MNKNDLVKEYIMDRINNRTFTPGSIIDSSNTVKDELGVSLMTVRKAVQELVDDGILYKEQGRGTFVSLPPRYLGFKCGTTFSTEIKKLGMKASTKDASIELISADEELASIFNVEVGHKLWKVKRVRYANDLPVMDATEYFLYSQAKDLTIDIVYDSIYNFLESKGIHYHHADQKIEAFSATKEVAERLRISEHQPLVKVTLISMVQNGNIFSYSIEHFHTSVYSLTQTIYA